MKNLNGRPRIEDENQQRSVFRNLRFTPLESLQIDQRMEELGYITFSKMIYDLLFLSEIKAQKVEWTAFLVQINRVGNNINQIAHRLHVNEEKRLVASDLRRLEELRELLVDVIRRIK